MAARKVFIVDDADRMTDDTPHAFLKTLEEPPDRTVMILVLASVRALPATVLSRCQIVRFAPQPDRAGGGGARARPSPSSPRFAPRGPTRSSGRLQSVDRETAENLIDAYWLFCRDLLLAQSGAPPSLLVHASAAGEIAREAARWSMEDLLAEFARCRDARAALETNVSPRLTVEVLLSRLATRAA